jgi:hypothetical protein
METIITLNIFVFLIVSFIGVVRGLDPKKWSSWLLSLYAFLSGSLIGLLRPGEPLSFLVGAICACGVMSAGIMVRRNRQLYTKEDLQSARNELDKLHAAAKKNREEKAGKNK